MGTITIGIAEIKRRIAPCGKIGEHLYNNLMEYNMSEGAGWTKGESWSLGDSPAIALALNPDILCFDEPTSALDPELTGEVLNVIKGLKSADSTMIVVTHEIGFAHDVADKIIFMDDGYIEEEGTPQQVIDNPTSERTKEFLARFNQFGD